jgi:phosphoglucomutase
LFAPSPTSISLIQDPVLIAASPVDSLKLPTTLGGFKVTYFRDLTVGYDSSNPPTFKPSLPIDPKSHMISFAVGSVDTGDGVEVTGTVRTSGTEPKVRLDLLHPSWGA